MSPGRSLQRLRCLIVVVSVVGCSADRAAAPLAAPASEGTASVLGADLPFDVRSYCFVASPEPADACDSYEFTYSIEPAAYIDSLQFSNGRHFVLGSVPVHPYPYYYDPAPEPIPPSGPMTVTLSTPVRGVVMLLYPWVAHSVARLSARVTEADGHVSTRTLDRYCEWADFCSYSDAFQSDVGVTRIELLPGEGLHFGAAFYFGGPAAPSWSLNCKPVSGGGDQVVRGADARCAVNAPTGTEFTITDWSSAPDDPGGRTWTETVDPESGARRAPWEGTAVVPSTVTATMRTTSGTPFQVSGRLNTVARQWPRLVMPSVAPPPITDVAHVMTPAGIPITQSITRDSRGHPSLATAVPEGALGAYESALGWPDEFVGVGSGPNAWWFYHRRPLVLGTPKIYISPLLVAGSAFYDAQHGGRVPGYPGYDLRYCEKSDLDDVWRQVRRHEEAHFAHEVTFFQRDVQAEWERRVFFFDLRNTDATNLQAYTDARRAALKTDFEDRWRREVDVAVNTDPGYRIDFPRCMFRLPSTTGRP